MENVPDVNALAGEVLKRNQTRKAQQQVNRQTEQVQEVEEPVQEEPHQAPEENERDGEIWAFRFRRPPFSIRKVPEFKVVFDAQTGSSIKNSQWFRVSPEYMKNSKFHIRIGVASTAYLDKIRKLSKYVNLQDIHLMSPFHMKTVPILLLDGYLQDTSRTAGTELLCFTPVEDFGIDERNS